MSSFTKPPLSIAQHIALYRERGLVISSEESAAHYLQFIGYYRLSGYARPFQTGSDHRFREGTHFEDILDLYIFDRKLRLFLLDAIERIEIAARAVVNNTMAEAFGAHWYLNPAAFDPKSDHAQIISQLAGDMNYYSPKKQDTFIAHYLATYQDPPYPPCWMMIETVSFGTVSWMYKDLALGYQKRIAESFGLQHRVLASILHALSYLRNLCAHHARVWNREFRIKPTLPKNLDTSFVASNGRLAAFVAIIEFLLIGIAPGSEWRDRFEVLLNEHPQIPRHSMGFSTL